MILANIKKSIHFPIIVDGTQDCTRQEQEFICIRYIDENLEPQKVFVGLFAVDDTTDFALSHMIEDVLLRLDLQITSLRGQSYDGAANMSVHIKVHKPLSENIHRWHYLFTVEQHTARIWLHKIRVMLLQLSETFSTIRILTSLEYCCISQARPREL